MTGEGGVLGSHAGRDSWMFVVREAQLARELGVARVIHEDYSSDKPDAKTVMSWLQLREAINETNDTTGVIRRLAAAGQDGKRINQPLVDSQLQAIRDAFEDLTQTDRERLGPGVGQAIVIDGYQFDKEAQRIPIQASPACMYLPRSIDKEPFAVAAGNTPGLMWVEPRYATVLRSPHGRTGLGAQRPTGCATR